MVYAFTRPLRSGNPDPGFYTLKTTVRNLHLDGQQQHDVGHRHGQLDRPGGHHVPRRQPAIFDDTAGTVPRLDDRASPGVNPYSVTFNNNTKAYSFSNASGAVGIGGTGSVTLNGSAAVTFTSPNTYTGGTFLNAGSNLIVSNDNQLGTAPPSAATNITFAGGTLTFSGSTNLNGLRSIVLNAGGGTLNMPTVGTTVVFTSLVTGSGGLTVTGDGDLKYPLNGGSNTYSGGTVITGGTIELAGISQGLYSGRRSTPTASSTRATSAPAA